MVPIVPCAFGMVSKCFERELGKLDIRGRIKTIQTIALFRGARGVMVIVIGIGHGDTSSNPGRD